MVAWKPGDNCYVRIPLSEEEEVVPERVSISDAWDGSSRDVQVCGARQQDIRLTWHLRGARQLGSRQTCVGGLLQTCACGHAQQHDGGQRVGANRL